MARVRAEVPGLKQYYDKVALKRRFRAEGLPTLEILFTSRTGPEEAADVMRQLRHYVVKVTHRDGGRGVFVVHDGNELLSGQPMTVDEIVQELRGAWDIAEWCGGDTGRTCRWRGWAASDIP